MAIKELKIENKLLSFAETQSAMNFLNSTEEIMFIIFCDINLPGKNGLEFKKDIDANPKLRKKSIPFLFFSTAANQKDVNIAYEKMAIQGFFKKPIHYSELKDILSNIFTYWKTCKHPNSQDLD